MLRYGVAIGSVVLCVATAVATWAILGTVVYVGGYGNTEYVVLFGLWDSTPYLALIALVALQRRSLVASATVLFGTTAICAFGINVLYHSLHPHFYPKTPGTPGVMNCVGPVIELGLPIIQLLGIGLLWAAAASLGLLQICFVVATTPRGRSRRTRTER